MTTAGIGWTSGVLGVMAASSAAITSLWGLAAMRTVVFFVALAILFFGAGCLMVLMAESGRRAGLAVQRAFELGVEYARAQGASVPQLNRRGEAA